MIFSFASVLGTRTDAAQCRFGHIAATTNIAKTVSIIARVTVNPYKYEQFGSVRIARVQIPGFNFAGTI